MINEDPTGHTMEFGVMPPKHIGLFSTLRDGNKWAEVLSIGDHMFADGESNRMYKVVGVLNDLFDNIPASIHKTNYDPNWQTKKGAADGLNQIYGEKEFPGRTMVTVVFLVPWDG